MLLILDKNSFSIFIYQPPDADVDAGVDDVEFAFVEDVEFDG